MPAVYDDEKSKDDALKDRPIGNGPAADELRKITGISPEQEEAIDREARTDVEDIPKTLSPSELSSAESAGSKPSETAEESREKEDAGANEIPYTQEKPRRIRITRNQGIVAGIIGIVIAGAFGISTILQGPLQIVHFSQLLQRFHFLNDQEFMDGRAGKIIRYARTRNEPQRRNLSYLSNKLADKYEVKLRSAGMEPIYEGGRAGRLNALEIDIRTPEGKRVVADLKSRGIDAEVLSLEEYGPGKRRIDLNSTKARTRRLAVNSMIDSLDQGKITSSIATRVLKIRAQVDMHPLKNISRSADEKLSTYIENIKKERDKARLEGADDTSARASAEGEDPDTDPSNNPPDAGEAAGEMNDITNNLVDEVDPPTPEIAQSASKLKGNLSKGAGALGAVALLCGLYQLGKAIPELKHANLVLPLIRIGMETVSMGSQVMSGQDVNMDELGAMTEQMYQVEKTIQNDDGTTSTIPESSWASAKSVQAELGESQTGPDMPSGARPNTDQPEFFKILSGAIDGIGAGPACDAVSSTVGGWAIDIFSWVTSATGPISLALNVASDIGTGVVVGSFMDDAIRWLVGSPLALDVGGALFGNYANYGALLAANDGAIAHGGIPLSNAQVSALNNERDVLLAKKFENKPLLTRYFDLQEPDSMASKIAFGGSLDSVKNPTSNIARIATSPLTIFGGIAKNMTPKVKAANNYDYGFPKFGFSLDEMDNVEYDDPIKLSEEIEPALASLNEKYGKCFNTTVNPTTFALETKSDAIRYDTLNKPDYAECKNRSNNELTKYRFYLADMTAAKSLACFDDIDDAACKELGAEGSGGAATTTQAGPAGSPTAPCSVGTPYLDDGHGATSTDGIFMTGKDHNVPIRICVVQGMAVNVQIEKVVDSMINDARSAGVELKATSAFRTYEHQVELRRQNCGPTDYDIYQKPVGQCSPETAIPGTSNHEDGNAIDFTGVGKCPQTINGSCADPNNAMWNWLSQNAANYGFKQYSREAWHWSVSGG